MIEKLEQCVKSTYQNQQKVEQHPQEMIQIQDIRKKKQKKK